MTDAEAARHGFDNAATLLQALYKTIDQHAIDRNWVPVAWNLCDEPIGAAPYAPDGDGTTPAALRLRAERTYPGNGRVYLVRVTAVDATGNRAVECKTVVVPVVPVGSFILQVLAAATQAELDCQATPTAPPASTPNLIHTLTTALPNPN